MAKPPKPAGPARTKPAGPARTRPAAPARARPAGPAQARPSGPVPTRAALHEAALRHLARFSVTEAGLVRVLDRRVQRWARLREAEDAAAGGATGADGVAGAVLLARDDVRAVARAMVEAGVIDDATFAAARAARLARGGRSRRAAAAHLAAKGVDADTVAAALPDPDAELPAGLVYARKRRIGPFRAEPTAETLGRDRARLARAGFPRDVVDRVLAMATEDADRLVTEWKRG